MQYEVVFSNGADLTSTKRNFIKEVNKLLSDGWELSEGFSFEIKSVSKNGSSIYYFAQPMIKKEE